tara:strand:+ start:1690 stop:2079 length:390 start_codon:yes stop_codon:yes gene_type:complete
MNKIITLKEYFSKTKLYNSCLEKIHKIPPNFSLTTFNINLEFKEEIFEKEMLQITQEEEKFLEFERHEKEHQERMELEQEMLQITQEEEEKMLEFERQRNFFCENEYENEYEYYDYLDKKYMDRIEGVN